MTYKYTHFIPQNIAPKGTKYIEVYDSNGEKVCSIPLGRLTPPAKEKLYSFGLVSDMHLYKKGEEWVTWNPDAKFDAALSYFESQNCVFCAHAGDITQTGLYDEGDAVNLQPAQFEVYKEIRDKHNIPVYGICGNHESYVVPITNNLPELKTYTGTDLYYTVAQGNDLFIFIGQPYNVCPMSDEALQWLYETLEANRNKRCFIFVHPHISSGNPVGAYKSNPLFQNWIHFGVFKNLLNHYKNTVLFHGHTHVKFECQEQDKASTYSAKDGFRSVHVPSLSTPRDVVNGELVNRTAESQGYIVDAYGDCIVLNGMNFINNRYVAMGVFKIDTPLQTIPAGTFIDSTGTIEI
jgi:predicted phosphodiesterase